MHDIDKSQGVRSQRDSHGSMTLWNRRTSTMILFISSIPFSHFPSFRSSCPFFLHSVPILFVSLRFCSCFSDIVSTFHSVPRVINFASKFRVSTCASNAPIFYSSLLLRYFEIFLFFVHPPPPHELFRPLITRELIIPRFDVGEILVKNMSSIMSPVGTLCSHVEFRANRIGRMNMQRSRRGFFAIGINYLILAPGTTDRNISDVVLSLTDIFM